MTAVSGTRTRAADTRSSVVGLRAGHFAATVLACLTGYQVALMAGAPLARAAWGGTYSTLPLGLRAASVLPIAVYVLAALVVLRRVGHAVPWVSWQWAVRGAWMYSVVFTLSALANAASGSVWERWLMTPVALVLALLFLVAAVSRSST
jgi:hypothetical protein